MDKSIMFKDAFVERYKMLTDFDEFKRVSLTYLRRCIRVNTLKISIEELKNRLEANWMLTQVPWCREGFWIEHTGEEKRRDIGNLVEHMLGYFFVQEAASMIPPLVLEPRPGELVLDLCASPGSKTTQIAQYMENKGVLVSNDHKVDRIKALALNVQRMGVSNCIITMEKGWFFRGMSFDRILVDAPCSGTGAIRKSLKTLKMWNPIAVRRLAATQKHLIKTAFENLAENGVLVYSTCTCEPEENEGVVSYLLEEFDNAFAEDIHLNIRRSSPVTEFNGHKFHSGVKKCLRIWPQDNDTEGFFIAKIRKK
ncbi:MAG: RsmB/NOP family class I SAM-dependent RNA methyltransferase [Candidatus Woesearchaeota archaeon]